METIIPIITLLLGSIVTFVFSRIQNNTTSKRKFKEDHYCNLLESLQAFVGSTATTEAKQRFFSEYYKSWVYADEKVILAFKALIDSMRVDLANREAPRNGKELLGNIVLAIRKDLGIKDDLTYGAFEYIDVIERRET